MYFSCVLIPMYHAAEQSNVVLLAGTGGSGDHVPLLTDVSLLIPVAASLLAVTLVIIVVCIWVLKAKSRRNLERGKKIC